MTSWADLPPHWRTSFELAWNAYGRGTTPVGAALVDGAGVEVATGMNTRYDAAAGGPLAGSHLAHAEIVALAGLDARGTYTDYVLYTTLEPCLLCVGAAIMATVGEVRWAGIDPYAGATSVLGGSNPYLDRQMTRFTGPLPGGPGAFAAGMHLEFCTSQKSAGHVAAAYRAAAPEILAVADAMAVEGVAEAAARGTPIEGVFDRFCATLG